MATDLGQQSFELLIDYTAQSAEERARRVKIQQELIETSKGQLDSAEDLRDMAGALDNLATMREWDSCIEANPSEVSLEFIRRRNAGVPMPAARLSQVSERDGVTFVYGVYAALDDLVESVTVDSELRASDDVQNYLTDLVQQGADLDSQILTRDLRVSYAGRCPKCDEDLDAVSGVRFCPHCDWNEARDGGRASNVYGNQLSRYGDAPRQLLTDVERTPAGNLRMRVMTESADGIFQSGYVVMTDDEVEQFRNDIN